MTDASNEMGILLPEGPHPVFVQAVWDRVFDHIKLNYLKHDKTCASLPEMWMGRRGGVTALGDVTECDGCGVSFYYEGVGWTNYEECVNDPDLDEIRLCECCGRTS